MTTRLALVLLPLLAACATAPEVKEQRSYELLQPQADFALQCPAKFVTLSQYKGWPMKVGASCNGKQIVYKRSHPKRADWAPELLTTSQP